MNDINPELEISRKQSRQIIIRKMKHISQIDQEIRKNWKNLFKLMNKDQMQDSLKSPKRRLMTEVISYKNDKRQKDHKRLILAHTELKREKVHQRKRKNEQIFYKKKRPQDMHSLFKQNKRQKSVESGSSLSKRYSIQLQPKKSINDTLPFMLRKRTAKFQKKMGVIEHSYNDDLVKIKNKEDLKAFLNCQDRLNLINSMKGSKQWRSNEQQTI